VSGMPDEPTPEPEPAAEGELVDDVALQPESAPSSSPAAAVPVEPVDTGYTPSGVPTFDSVREKIETRYGASIGAAELDAESPEGRTVEEQYDARQRAAAERLDEIRKSMQKDRKDTDDAQ
jgi:phage shock protein A